MRVSSALVIAASSAMLFVPNAARALTWNWSVTGNNGSAQGTFTTAGTTAQAGVTQAITGVTGTYTRSNTGDNGTYTITGLGSSGGADNTFQWDGSNASPLRANSYGISFTFASTSNELNIYSFFAGSGYDAVDIFSSSFNGTDGSITSSTLAPQQSVPGPLPLLGAGAAFGWSRRLRRRVKSGSLKTTPLPTTTAI